MDIWEWESLLSTSIMRSYLEGKLEMQLKERSESAYLLMMVLSLHPPDQVQSFPH